MERRTLRNTNAFAKRKIKRMLATLMAIVLVATAIDYSGVQYVSAADESKANVIKAFTAISVGAANQQLFTGAVESDIYLPNSLIVSSEVYMVDATQTVTGSAISVDPTYNLTGVTWEIDAAQSSSNVFASSVGNTYTYVPVLPATDSEGNIIMLADGVSLPQIRVEIGDFFIGGVNVVSDDWYAVTDTSGKVTTEGATSDNFNIHVVKGDVSGTTTAAVTLKNATITNSSNMHGIKVKGYDLNIVLEGTANQIGVGTANEYGYAIYSSTENKVTITGEGDLTLKGYYGINVNGLADVSIHTTGNLNLASQWQMVQTSGKLTVSAKSIEAAGYYFMVNDISLTATDGDIHATGSGSYGIQASGDVTVSAPNGAISISGVEYAIKATDYSVNVAAKNNVTLTGTVSSKEVSINSQTGNLTINGYYKAIEGARNSVTLSAPSGDVLLNASRDSIIAGSNNFTLAITAAGKLEGKGPYGIEGYGTATIKADKVSVANTTVGYGFNGGALTITSPSGGNCAEVSISGGQGNRDAINAWRDVNIKADKVVIIAASNATHAINASSINGDVTVTIGDKGLIVGPINIKGTNAISEGMVHADKNGINASYGLNLNTNTPTQSTYYKAGEGYAIFEPASGETPATLTLHNATIHNGTAPSNNTIGMINEGIAVPNGNLILKVEGTNKITSSYGDGIGYRGSHVTLAGSGELTVDGNAGDIKLDDGSFSFADGADVTLNSVVSVRNDNTSQNTETVYGNMTVNTYFRNLYYDAIIAKGATVTVPEGQILWMDETDSITINGQIVNHGTIILPYDYTVEQIQALNLTGTILMRDSAENKSRIYMNGNIYGYGGMVDYNFSISSPPTEVTYYETINGYFFFTPASDDTQAKLTLHNVDLFGDFTLPDVPLTLYLEGVNTIEAIKASASIIVEGSGKLDVNDFKSSNASATLTVKSGATLNTKHNATESDITTNTIYGNYTLSEDSRFYVGSSQKLVLLPGAVFTLRDKGNLEFHSGTTLDDMTIGAGASIVNKTHITLPQGTTPEQIKALPLFGSGVVRVTTAYDNHGYPETWDTYTNEGLPITVVEGGTLMLTQTEVLESDNKGYTWNKTGEGNDEVWTLALKNTCIDGSLYLPNKAVVINSTTDSIINGNIGTNSGYALDITFTGTAPLTIGGWINGGIDGDLVTVQGGAKVTVDGAIFLGGSGGANGTLNVTGTGTTLNASSSMGYAVMCDNVNVQNGASMSVKAEGNDSIGVEALTGVSITGGSTLKAGCDYGVYITGGQKNGIDIVGKLTMDDSSKLITNGSVAPFCIVDRTSAKSKSDVLQLAGIPSGTQIASVQGTDASYGYTYWSLTPVDKSLSVTNENSSPVTLAGAVTGQLSFGKATTPGDNSGGISGGYIGTASYTLSFETNSGTKISNIYKENGTNIDLVNYKPTREGYEFDGWYSDKELTKKIISVKLTQNTTIYAKWTDKGTKIKNPFKDVSKSAYYYDAVLWATQKDITKGTSKTAFSPDKVCTRAQMVTFMWKAMGSPEPTKTNCPFIDVSKDTYYYKAVLWAVDNGITSGTTPTTFSPNKKLTRGQSVTFLWRMAGKPSVTSANPFTDVSKDSYYYEAILWADKKSITHGTSAKTFSPSRYCTRAQIVTFLYRYMGN